MRVALLVVAAVTASGCTLLAHDVPRECTPNALCAGLNTRFGIDPGACEVWWCADDGHGGPACRFGPPDRDSDGAATCGSDAPDCDDMNASVSPGATDACNGVDDDCDGVIDERDVIATDAVTATGLPVASRATAIALDDGRIAWLQSDTTAMVATATMARFAGAAVVPTEHLAWAFDDPPVIGSPLLVERGSPDVSPGALPPWDLQADVGTFVDLAATPVAGGRALVAAIDGAICREGRVRVGLATSLRDDGETFVEVIGGPRTGEGLRTTLQVLVDPVEVRPGEFCTGTTGASRVAVAVGAGVVGTFGSGVLLYAAGPATDLCPAPPVSLRVLGIVVERQNVTAGSLAWVSGLQAPGPDEGISTRIESIELGTLTGSGAPAVVANELGASFVAWPSEGDIVVARIDPAGAPRVYSGSRDPEARWGTDEATQLGMPILEVPQEIARFAAPEADHLALALSSDERTLLLAWQTCDAFGPVRAVTIDPVLGSTGTITEIAPAGRHASIAAADDLVRTGWPVASLDGETIDDADADGFVVGWSEEGGGAGVALVLRDGRPVDASAFATEATELRVAGAPRATPVVSLASEAGAIEAAPLRCAP